MPPRKVKKPVDPVETLTEHVAELNLGADSVDKKAWCLELVNAALETYSIKHVADALNICVGTIRRWQELNSVPPQYCFDLLRLLSKPIDCTMFSPKEKDQFFTPADSVKHCWDVFRDIIDTYADADTIDDYVFIEPSAGAGVFLDVLPASTIALDIEPRHPRVAKHDYLTWSAPPGAKYIVFGNPPFGLRGHLALQFIEHSAKWADYVCFILPQLFESDGKGSPRKRVKGYNLIHSEKLSTPFHAPDNGGAVDVNVVFQVWSKHHTNETYTIVQNKDSDITIYSLSDGGTVATTRNKAMIGACDIYLPSTCFGKEHMRIYESFEELPGRKGYGVVFSAAKKQAGLKKALETDWSTVSFLSTNSAYNLRTSLIQKALTLTLTQESDD